MKTVRSLLAAFGCLCLLTTALHAQVPQLLNYQGRVAVGTVNFDGSGLFKFALVDAAGTTTYWTNSPDTTPVDGIPDAAVTLTVTKGLYSVMLGDTAVANMAAIPASVFTNPDVRLRVWFDDGIPAHGSQRLTPDSRIAPSVYLADGTVTAAKIANNAVGATQIAPGAVGSAQLAAGAVQIGNLSIGAVGSAQIAPGAVGSSQLDPNVNLGLWTASGGNVFRSGGNVGIGTANPQRALSIDGIVESTSGNFGELTGVANFRALTAYYNNSYGNGTDGAGVLQAVRIGVGYTPIILNPQGGNIGIGTTTPAGILDVRPPDAASGAGSSVIIKAQKGAANNVGGNLLLSSGDNGADSGNGYIAFGIGAPVVGPSFSVNERMRISSAGNVGIGTTAPVARINVVSNDPSDPIAIFSQTNGSNVGRVAVDSPIDDSSHPALITFRRAGNDKWSLGGIYGSDSFGIGTASPLANQKVVVTTAGNVGIGTAIPNAPLEVAGPEATIRLNRNDGTGYFDLHASSAMSGSNADFFLTPGQPSSGIVLRARDADGIITNALGIDRNGNVGIGTGTPSVKLEVAGPVKATAFQGDGSALTGVGAIGPAGGDLSGSYPNPVIAPNAITITKIGTGAVGNVQLLSDAASLNKVSGGNIIVSGTNIGIGTATPSATLEVAGNIKITGAGNMLSTPKLAITGGADVAEPFDIAGEDIPAGSVVVIDEAHPGHLKLSDQPYDARVAGIVSGAGGVQPGLTLAQQGVLEGRHQVALVGRVYAQADATDVPIHPGDLLTTSSTPGHLMRATDRDRAQGAILGKAMTSLESGEGLVLVLVTLQ